MKGLLSAIADFEQLPVAAVVVDAAGTLVAVNRVAGRLAWKPTVGEPVWRGSAQLEGGWPSLVEQAKKQVGYDCEFTAGTATHYARISARYRDCDGTPYILACFVDITDCAANARDAASHRLECLGRVAGGLAHEFNNQLVSVVSEANMLGEDKALPEELREAVGRIDSAAHRMAGVTKQLLAFSGRGRFVSTRLDPNALLTDVRARIEKAIPSTIALHVEQSAEPITISADRNMLQQVIFDLAVNAADACGDSGTIRITSRATPTAWELEIRDDGSGMDTLTLNRIFEPFFTTKTNHRGLGLSAALGIIKSLGGDISVTSRLHHGTAFAIRLPAVQQPSAPQRQSEPRIDQLVGLRVLVADDEASVRQTIQRLLVRRQAIPVIACDGGSAEELLRSEHFDVVLLDVMMPKRTGDELLPIARSLHPNTPVIVMSGFSDKPPGTEPPDAFMQKPFNIRTLEMTIHSALRTKRAPRPTDSPDSGHPQDGSNPAIKH